MKIYYRTENKTDIESLLTTVTKHFLNIVLAPHKSWQKTSVAFLRDQVDKQSESLQVAEQELADYKTKFALELPELHKANVTRLAELRQQLMEKKTDLAGAEAALEEFNGNLIQTNPLIGKLEEKLINTKAEISMLRSKYTEKHSKVQASRRELERLELERQKLISQSRNLQPDDVKRLWNLAASSPVGSGDNQQGQTTILASQLQAVQEANAKVTSLKNEVDSVQSMADDLLQKVQSFAQVERSLVGLQRSYNIKLTLYNDFLNRYEMAVVTGNLGQYEESERVQVIDEPFTPSSPNKLPAALFIVAGLFAGLGIGTGLSAIAEISDTSLRLQETIEKMAGLPVLARLPIMPDAPPLTYDTSTDMFNAEVTTT